jgi:hypothetical protein
MVSKFKLLDNRPIANAKGLEYPHFIYEVSNGKFNEIASIYSKFINLEVLMISDNEQSNITQENVESLSKTIKQLTLISNGMNKIDLFYNRLSNLETIEVRYVQNPISEAISNLKQLKKLIVRWHPKCVPAFALGLSQCIQLDTLELHSKKPIDLSNVIGHLPNLRELKVNVLADSARSTTAIVFPDNMYEFPSGLEILEIHTKGNVVKLPSNISILFNMKTLKIYSSILNNVEMLNNIECMPNLEKLDILRVYGEGLLVNTNVLHNLEILHIQYDTNVNYVNLDPIFKKQIKLVKPDFANNPKLLTLYLDGLLTDDFDNFPESITHCKKLTSITFRKDNYRIIIPDGITDLKELYIIELCGDPYDLKYIPHPDNLPSLNTINSSPIHFGGNHISLESVYKKYMSPECKCRNPYYYLDKWRTQGLYYNNGVQCMCPNPGLIDETTGQIITFPSNIDANTHNLAEYIARVNAYIEARKPLA